MDTRSYFDRFVTPFLIAILLVGAALILSPILFRENTWFTVAKDFGIALFIASFLGLTVDKLLRKQLAKDAFRASMGYLLPEELKPELEWVYSQRVVATKHVQYCEIKPLTDNLVSVNITLNRTLQNVTNSKVKIPLQLSIDEWFHEKNPSEIIEFGWRNNDTGREPGHFEYVKGKRFLEIKPIEVTLNPRGLLDTWCKYAETKHMNDEHTLTHIYATRRPLIHVKAFEGIEIEASSVQHYQMSLKTAGECRYEFNGTLLPGHPITIRWWRVSDSKKWLGENEKKES